MDNQRSPESLFRAADRAADHAIEVNPENSLAYQTAAEVHRWRAEWRLVNRQPVAPEIREGRRHIREALDRKPGLVAALITDAALLAINAQADLEQRRALTRQARLRLEEAQRLNPLISRNVEIIATRLDRLENEGR